MPEMFSSLYLCLSLLQKCLYIVIYLSFSLITLYTSWHRNVVLVYPVKRKLAELFKHGGVKLKENGLFYKIYKTDTKVAKFFGDNGISNQEAAPFQNTVLQRSLTINRYLTRPFGCQRPIYPLSEIRFSRPKERFLKAGQED